MELVKVLFLGDLVGPSVLRTLYSGLASLKAETGAHIVAVNGENLADGFGITKADTEHLFGLGVAAVTSGNHVWQRDEIYPTLDSEPRLLRPLNYPSTVPGHGSTVVDIFGTRIGFINILGQIRMGMTVDCPFKTGKKVVEELRKQTKVIVVDFHAEDVREKEAMVHHLNGRVSAVLGTHTHVQTADARISPGGTAALTDLGMCGPVDSVIGTVPEVSIRRSMTQLPLKMEVLDSPGELNGALLSIETASGRAVEIVRIRRGTIVG